MVNIRKRALQDGGYSLFLDYTLDGIRHRVPLNMHLVAEHTRIDKLQNQETMKQARAAAAQKTLAIQSGEPELAAKRVKDILVVDYLSERIGYYQGRGQAGYATSISSVRSWLLKSCHRMSVKTATKRQIQELLASMQGVLSDTTINNYYLTLNTQFKAAVRDGIIQHNVFDEFAAHEKPKTADAEREYLTIEELRRLAKTELSNESVRQAFFFSCYTGLRISDIRRLTWDKIRRTDSGLQVEARQKKTRSLVYIPLSAAAQAFLPSRRENSEDKRIWPNIPASSWLCALLDDWVKRAGINKHITFHCSRHTCATLLLNNDVDLYTVSKILGHSKITTTQIYAKIMDQKKVAAVNVLPEL